MVVGVIRFTFTNFHQTQTSLKTYLASVQQSLQSALDTINTDNITISTNIPSHPDIEFSSTQSASPVIIARNEHEHVMIECAENSLRLSVKLKQSDELESFLCDKFTKLMMRRAEKFHILRRIPIQGYNLTFLVTAEHLKIVERTQLVEFVVMFMQEVDKEISDLKICINARGREIAEVYLKQLV